MCSSRAGEDWIQFPISDALPLAGWPLRGPAEEGAFGHPAGTAEQVGAAEPPSAAVADAVSSPMITLRQTVLAPVSFLGMV